MSKKFHVNQETGNYGKCTAEPGNCPLGGDTGTDNHYTSKNDAVMASEKVLENIHGAFQIKKNTKYANEDWSEMPTPDMWETETSEGVEIEGKEAPYWNYASDNVGYQSDGYQVTSVDMETYVADYLGGLSKDELPESVKDLIEKRSADWTSDGFETELRDGEDDDGRNMTYVQVTPPGSLEDDLEEHYHRMTNK